MQLARVVGPIWGARHASGLSGYKVLELTTMSGGRLCAIDTLGAGPGEWVLVAHGSRVRDLTVGAQVADKDIVIAIVDGFDYPGRAHDGELAAAAGVSSAPAGPAGAARAPRPAGGRR